MQVPPEAFLLLSLPNCTLSSRSFSDSGVLGLECVTISIPDTSGPSVERDVYLILRINISEIPIDPTRVVQRSDTPNARIYTFYSSPNDPDEFVLTIPTPPGDTKSTALHEDLDTFEGILEQYAADFRSPTASAPVPQTQIQDRAVANGLPKTYTSDEKDLRGRLVMINEDTGEVVGEVEDRFRIREDPAMYQRGHENDPIVIEVPDEGGLREDDAGAMEAFARIVPPDQHDWITKSAAVASTAISLTTNLLVTTITGASNYYISKSTPSAPQPSNSASNRGGEKSTPTPTPGARSTTPTPPPPPPRALVFLTSEKTRKGLQSVHAVSGQAVKVSAKTVKTVDNMIRSAMGARPKKNRLGYTPAPHGSLAPIPHANPSPQATGAAAEYYGFPPSSLSPPQWNSGPQPPSSSRSSPGPTLGPRQPPPPLPPRSVSPAPPPRLPPRSVSPAPPSHFPPPQFPSSQFPPPHLPSSYFSPPQGPAASHSQYNPQVQTSLASPPLQPKLSKASRLLISADLILSTIDDSARKLLDTGTENIGRVMHHKYGPEAAESSLLMAGTARNVGLVYIDMSGMGRRALLRRAGMSFVKGRVQSKRPVPPVPGQEAQKR